MFREIHEMVHGAWDTSLPPDVLEKLETLHNEVHDRDIDKVGRVLSGENEEDLKRLSAVLLQASAMVTGVLSRQSKAPVDDDHRPTFKRSEDGSWRAFCPIVKIDTERRVVTSIVLAANTIDLQNDYIRPDEIWKAMESYMLAAQTVGIMHEKSNPFCKVVEGFQAWDDHERGGQPVHKGDWVMSVKVGDDDIWQDIVNGDLTGFSIGGFGKRVPVAEVPSEVKTLEQSLAA